MSERNYSVGDCAYLAAAILEIDPYAFQVAVFDGAGSHVAAIHDGNIIDIHGTRSPAEVAAQWQAEPPTIYQTWDQVWAAGWDVCLEECDIQAACGVLASAGLLTPERAEMAADLIDRRY